MFTWPVVILIWLLVLVGWILKKVFKAAENGSIFAEWFLMISFGLFLLFVLKLFNIL